jgi:hypothetical protein
MLRMRGHYSNVDRENPEAAAICDRGGEAVRHSELRREMHYAGGRLVWNGLLVCDRHRDVPNPQDGGLRVARNDPQPVANARPQPVPVYQMTDADGAPVLEASGRPLLQPEAVVDEALPILTDDLGNPLLDEDRMQILQVGFFPE